MPFFNRGSAHSEINCMLRWTGDKVPSSSEGIYWIEKFTNRREKEGGGAGNSFAREKWGFYEPLHIPCFSLLPRQEKEAGRYLLLLECGCFYLTPSSKNRPLGLYIRDEISRILKQILHLRGASYLKGVQACGRRLGVGMLVCPWARVGDAATGELLGPGCHATVGKGNSSYSAWIDFKKVIHSVLVILWNYTTEDYMTGKSRIVEKKPTSEGLGKICTFKPWKSSQKSKNCSKNSDGKKHSNLGSMSGRCSKNTFEEL